MKSLIKNLSIVTIAEITEKAIIFSLFIYMGRVLSPYEFGVLNYLLALLSYFVIFIDFGLPQLATRELAAHPKIGKKILEIVISIKTISFVVVSILWIVYSIGYQKEHLWISIFMVIYLFARVLDLFWYFQAKQQFKKIAKIKFYKSVILSFSYIALYYYPHFAIYFLFLTLALTIPFVVYIFKEKLSDIYSLSKIKRYYKRDKKRMLIYFCKSLPLIVSTFLILLYYNLDTVLIKYYLGYEAVAQYNAAYKIIFAFIVVRSVFVSIIFPRISEKKLDWHEDKMFAMLGITVGIFIAIFMYYFGEDILYIAYGSKYLASKDVLMILSLTASLLWVNLFYPIFFVAIKKDRFYMKVHILTAFLNLIGNIILIPMLGIEGAAISTLLADMVSLGVFGVFYYRMKNEIR